VETYRRVGGPVEEAGGMEVGRWMWPSGVEAGQWRREADGGGCGGWAMGSGGVRARAWAGQRHCVRMWPGRAPRCK
jgi:hypothetical protein